MTADHKLDRNCTKKLHCSNSTPASFYGLPKIHKPERPLRPITSSIGSPTYAVSKHLVSILSPLRRNRFSVKNSSEFAQKIQQHTVASNEIMVSFDVKSLFTSIPVDLALTIVNERLQKDQDLAERTNMSTSNIMRLLDHNYFKRNNIHYKQIFGCAMGSPISPVIADLGMEEIEETAIATAPHPTKSGGSVMWTTVTRVPESTKWMSFTNISIQLTPTYSSL